MQNNQNTLAQQGKMQTDCGRNPVNGSSVPDSNKFIGIYKTINFVQKMQNYLINKNKNLRTTLTTKHDIPNISSTIHLKKISGKIERKPLPITQTHHVLFNGDWSSPVSCDAIFYGDIDNLKINKFKMKSNILRLAVPSPTPNNRKCLQFMLNDLQEVQYSMMMNGNQYIHNYFILPNNITMTFRDEQYRFIKQTEERRMINDVMFDVVTYIRKNKDSCCSYLKRVHKWINNIMPNYTTLQLEKLKRNVIFKFNNMNGYLKLGSNVALWFGKIKEGNVLNYPTKAIQIGVAVTMTASGQDRDKLKYYSLASLTEMTNCLIVHKNYRVISEKSHFTEMDDIDEQHITQHNEKQAPNDKPVEKPQPKGKQTTPNTPEHKLKEDKIINKTYTVNVARKYPDFYVTANAIQFKYKPMWNGETPMVFDNPIDWEIGEEVSSLVNTCKSSCGFEAVQYYCSNNIEIDDEMKKKFPLSVDNVLVLAKENGLNLMVYVDDQKKWYTGAGLHVGQWAAVKLSRSGTDEIGHYTPLNLKYKRATKKMKNTKQKSMKRNKTYQRKGAGLEDIDTKIDEEIRIPAKNIGVITNSLGTTLMPESSKSREIDKSGEGCEPQVGAIGNLHAYLMRYHNKAKHITENNHEKLFKLAERFARLVKKKLPPLTPKYSKKQLLKYKRWFDEHKLSTMPEKDCHNIFVKREYYDTLNRNRVISDVDKITTIKLLAFVNPLHKAMLKHLKCYKPGKDKDESSIHENPGYSGCDCSGLDGTISVVLRECERIFLTTMFPKFSNELNNLLDKELYGLFNVAIIDGHLRLTVPTMGTRLSGSALTSLGNTFIMIFKQWCYFVTECGYDEERALTAVGWCYGDDTTADNKHMKQLSAFAGKLGIELTQETSKYGTIMFLSELVTPDGNIVDINRTISKAYRYFSCFSDKDGFIYKLTGYYNPNKPIFDEKTHMYQQAPCFSLFGYYAHLFVQASLPRNTTLTVQEIIERKYNILGDDFKYNVEMGHGWADYDQFFPDITKVHIKYKKLLSENLNNVVANDNHFNMLKKLFIDMLADLKPVDERSIILNPKKTRPVAGDIILQHGHTSILVDCEPQVRFIQFVHKHKSQDLALALCNKYIRFWDNIITLIDKGQFYENYRAAAEKILTYFTLYYKQLKLNFKLKNKQNNAKTKQTKQTKQTKEQEKSKARPIQKKSLGINKTKLKFN
jgi:hypothetical protein